jgi:hypothetical protein
MSRHRALSPYLFDAGNLRDRHLVVEERSEPLCGQPQIVIGSKPIDDGNYIFDANSRTEFLRREPRAGKYLHPFIGSEEFINNGKRWIIVPMDIPPAELRQLPLVLERVAAARKFRQKSRSAGTRELPPTEFHVTVIPDAPFLVIPEVSSERREYVPIGWLEPPTIPSNLVRILPSADRWHFGILTSRMHMAWLRNIGGRLKSDYRYSIGIVYNNFPWPEATEKQKQKIRTLAQAVLDARTQFPNATLADLYDADAMPPKLRKAHRDLDSAVDNLYRRGGFAGDRVRVEHLFTLYERLIAPLTAAPSRARRHRIGLAS